MEKIDVGYNDVDSSVPKLWSELQPDLTIHVGVSSQTQCFLLETQANKVGYEIEDVTGECPVDFKHWSNGPETITTALDVDILCKEFNCTELDGLRAEKSNDAGRYLCEYIYYTSLCCQSGSSQTLFIHVPLEYEYEKIAQGLERILELCLGQLRQIC